jgi:LacI family transcriptional regulator
MNDAPSKVPTIKDVAREAGVSFKTVSRVINRNPSVNPQMRRAVEEAMQRLGYRPHHAARALRGQRSFSLALLTGWSEEPPELFGAERKDGPHFSEFLSELTIGCSVACRRVDYHLIYEFLSYGDRERAERSLSGLLDNLRPDGLLIAPPLCDIGWLLDRLDARQVRYARLLPGTDLARGLSFIIDDFGAAKAMTAALLEAGHRRLGMIAGPADHFAANKRREGFEAAVAEVPEARGTVTPGTMMMESGRQKALVMLRSAAPPTAIFAANDAMAAGVYAGAADLSLAIPRQLSVIGFDDTLIAGLLNPPLTTVRQPIFEMAGRAVDLLVEAADAGKMPEGELITLAHSISRRGTIAPPAAG